MENIKKSVELLLKYILTFIKWLGVAVIIGAVGGAVGSAFHMLVEMVTELRNEYSAIIFLLPVGGVLIAAMYNLFKKKGKIDTNRVIEAVREDEKVPLIMLPLIFISTVISHLLGASVGREGAALQIGGSIGYNFGKLLKLNESNMHIIIMAGMSSVFAALFGTPIAAAIFALEVINVGVFKYAGLLACIMSATVAYGVSTLFSVEPVRFAITFTDVVSADVMAKAVLLSLLCAVVSIVFLTAVKKCEHYTDKLIKNNYVRAFFGGVVIVILTLLAGCGDYNGAGMGIIENAISGNAKPWAFVLKIIFTAVSIAAGFRGGEIVPTLFIGATFGCAVSHFVGLDAGVAAAIGMISLFCCVVNCPIASVLLAAELFGGEGMIYFAVVSAVSYMMSGCFGLYKSQKIIYSKLDTGYIDKNTI